MPLPLLFDDWKTTRDSLHRAAQVLGQIRKAHVDNQPNALHLALFVTPDGLTTGPLKDGASLELRFEDGLVRGVAADGRVFAVSLKAQNGQSLTEALAHELGLEAEAVEAPEHSGPALFELNPAQGAGYAHALYAIYTGLARFRARLLGTMTPLVVWPHGFDLSSLWFFGSDPDESSQPHFAVGFSPGTAELPRPYLYAYAWPWPEGVEERPLSAGARWHNGEWRGALLEYDDFRAGDTPEHTVEAVARAFYEVLTAK